MIDYIITGTFFSNSPLFLFKIIPSCENLMMGYNCLELTLNYQLDQMQPKILFLFKFFSSYFYEVHKKRKTQKNFYPSNDKIYLNMMYVVLCTNPFFIYCSINIEIHDGFDVHHQNAHLYQSGNKKGEQQTRMK
jgi:hypothetical protein